MIQVELWNEIAPVDTHECSTMKEACAYIRDELLPVLDEGDTIKITGEE